MHLESSYLEDTSFNALEQVVFHEMQFNIFLDIDILSSLT